MLQRIRGLTLNMGTLLILAVYICFFGVVHSLMAANKVKTKIHRFVEPPQYRLIYTIVSIFLILPILVLWGAGKESSPVVFVVPQPYNLISYMVILSGVILFVMVTTQIDIFEFLGANAILKKKSEDSKLITDGFYSISRHPIYLFAIIILWSFPELRLIDLVGNGFITLYFVIGAWFEEQRMVEEFGQEYLEYQRNVSMFIPFNWLEKKFK